MSGVTKETALAEASAEACSDRAHSLGGLLGHVAFWQAMTFFMLVCAVWGLHFAAGSMDRPVSPDSPLHWIRPLYLSGCIGLVGVITVAHTYIQQRRILGGLVISCAHCRRIRLESTEWENLETYVSRRTTARFSHGICPDCLSKHFDD